MAVRAGGGDRSYLGTDGEWHRVGGAPDADGGVLLAQVGIQVGSPRQDQGERSRPITLHQTTGLHRHCRAQRESLLLAGHEHRQLDMSGAALQTKKAVRGAGVEGVGSETVDRVGRHPDNVASRQGIHCHGDRSRRRGVTTGAYSGHARLTLPPAQPPRRATSTRGRPVRSGFTKASAKPAE